MTLQATTRPGPICEREPGCLGRVPESFLGGRAGFGWLVLPRHGRRPLAVYGRLLLGASNRCAGLDAWSDIAVHETAGGRLALALCHRCHPADGPPWCDAWLCTDAGMARAALLAHDPLHGLASCWAAGQAPRLSGFQAAWQGMLAAVLGQDAPWT